MADKVKKGSISRFINNVLPFWASVIGIPFVLSYHFTQVVPYCYGKLCFGLVVHLLIFSFMLTNFLCNIYLFRQKQPVWKGKQMHTGNYKFCEICNADFPERTYHCKRCGICALKKDHHCHLLGRCVSYWNRRYFIATLFYWWIGGFYILYFFIYFTIDRINSDAIETTVCFMAPYLGIALEIMNFEIYITILLQYLIATCIAIVTSALFGQIYVMYRGSTLHEQAHKIKIDNTGSIKENFLEIFGDRWYLVLISPFTTSTLPVEEARFSLPKST